MNKPSIFFSHSSKDKAVLTRLKTLFTEKTGQTIDVFLSSDGQSIPLGRNWVHRIQEALESTTVMVVFLTPNSVSSSWIYFESGFAYSKGIKVIPVGLLGVDLTQIPPPLSLLQGFNIRSQDGLNNLIALANTEFSHSHTASFNDQEMKDLLALSDTSTGFIGENSAALIKAIYFFLSASNDRPTTIEKSMSALSSCLAEHNIEFTALQTTMLFHGVSIQFSESNNKIQAQLGVDPLLLTHNVQIINEIADIITGKGCVGSEIRIVSVDGIDTLSEFHNISARIFGTDIRLVDERHFKFKQLHFSTRSGSYNRTYTRAWIDINALDRQLSATEIFELVNILYERGVLYQDNEMIIG
ncbi:MAG TPA: toll/interleukin-1 receptor domain-containing protein [Kiritimatiellia bacterium]|nr:toll/interleukin-1 receptor domain-containing protein [Kiritimatiellia bacterium]HMP00744.1 toll/interleukin-1 receptor domain-containing protein [Kiritimatiellia bacterium]